MRAQETKHSHEDAKRSLHNASTHIRINKAKVPIVEFSALNDSVAMMRKIGADPRDLNCLAIPGEDSRMIFR